MVPAQTHYQQQLDSPFLSPQKPKPSVRRCSSSVADCLQLFCCSAGTSIVFDMSLTYILVALVAVILNNALMELLSLHTRISVGRSLPFFPLPQGSKHDLSLPLHSGATVSPWLFPHPIGAGWQASVCQKSGLPSPAP